MHELTLNNVALVAGVVFGSAALALLPLSVWLARSTRDDRRSVRRRASAALRGEWRDRPAATWYRRAFATVLVCWVIAVISIIVLNVAAELR